MAKLFDFTIKIGDAKGFSVFGAEHISWLLLLLAAGACLCRAYKKADANGGLRHGQRSAWSLFARRC